MPAKQSVHSHSDPISAFIRRNNVLSIKRITIENDVKLKFLPPQLKSIRTIPKISTQIDFSFVFRENHLFPNPASPLSNNLPLE
jgi:hypothetical protein